MRMNLKGMGLKMALKNIAPRIPPVLSLIPSFSLPDVLWDRTDLIWREGTPFEAMIGHTVLIDDLLTEVFRSFLGCKVNSISLSPLTSVDKSK